MIKRFLSTCYYTKNHEWIRRYQNGHSYEIGMTRYALKSLGDVVFVTLKSVGSRLAANGTLWF